MKFRPCIDLHAGRVKQIVGNTLTDTAGNKPITNFETCLPPEYFAKMYSMDKLDGGHVIMLGPGNEAAAKRAFLAYPGGLHAGGGINPENACNYIDAGASHVIVTSYVFQDGAINRENLKRMTSAVGKERLVLDLSCKKINGQYFIATDRWQKISSVSITEETLCDLGEFCDEFLVHAVDVEGRQQGIDIELVGLLADISPVAATYAGGVRSIDDMEMILETGKGLIDATIGSSLDIFGGNLSYSEVVQWHKKHNKKS
jgi:phosphoribosylformimino-5-aminoimidazole carboxamide ribotide isomerase